MKARKYLLLTAFLLGIFFTRFFNIEKTSRFTRDESYNLWQMKRIWVEKDLTLIGPMDPSLSVIHPSLMFYILLPFAIVGNFTPVSPAIGTAFMSLLTAILFLFLVKKINKDFLILIGVLLVVWIPFVESGRWAWNPHLVPLMTTLALILVKHKNNLSKIFSGIFLGLSFHLHFFTAIASGIFMVLKKNLLIFLGFVLTIIPFVVFDLTHPPGLFFGHYLRNNMVLSGSSKGLENLVNLLIISFKGSLSYISQLELLAIPIVVLILILVIYDFKKKKSNLIYFLPVIAQVSAISSLPRFENRYFLLASVFFLVWLIQPRPKIYTNIAKVIITLMVIGSLLTQRDILTSPSLPPGTYVARVATEFIADSVSENEHKNINLAVLASPDQNPYGAIYRHTLEIKNLKILAENQYDITDNLFVITTSGEEAVRGDPSNIMQGFRKGKLRESFEIPQSPWKIYLFNRN